MKSLRLLGFSLCLVLAGPLRAADLPTYSTAEAKKHVGEDAHVVGQVSQVHESAKGDVFIDFGPAYPNRDFTAVIFSSVRAKFGDLALLTGKNVTVTGKIKLYHDDPEIVVDEPAQLKPKSVSK